MLHDALFMLWDCKHSDKDEETIFFNNADKELYSRIAEIAGSYHRIKSFTEIHSFRARKVQTGLIQQGRIIGLYSQAFSESVDQVLRNYGNTLVEIESSILNDERLSLSFIYGKVQPYISLFFVLNKIIAHIKDLQLHGCQILGIVHQHLLTGNELVRECLLKIYSHINSVFINQLISWLLYGELKDDYKEFFISKIGKEGNETRETLLSSHSTMEKTGQSDNCTLLDSEYTIETKLLPYFIPLSLAQDVLFIGKTVLLFGFDPKDIASPNGEATASFLPLQRNSNNRRFTIWDDKESEFHKKLQSLKEADESYFHTSRLKLTIKEIKSCVTRHLWAVTVEEAKLINELKLMKDFYLLGRGELFLELLRISSNVLEEPITRTSGRDMNQAFQLSARAVFLDNNVDVEKFYFEIPYVKHNTTDASIESNKDGWSAIVLKYKFKWPLHLLFAPEVLAQYNDMFRFLLRIKKTQHDLHTLWKVYRRKKSRHLFELHNKLMFVMDNLQHYLQADVLDSNFSKLMARTESTRDFEELKLAHATFLQDILSQSFLYSSESIDESDSSFEDESELKNPVLCNIMHLLKLCHSFCSMSDDIDDDCDETYYLLGYSQRFETLMSSLLQLLASKRSQLCGTYLARLLMRLDYNRWFSSTAHLTQSVTNMLY